MKRAVMSVLMFCIASVACFGREKIALPEDKPEPPPSKFDVTVQIMKHGAPVSGMSIVLQLRDKPYKEFLCGKPAAPCVTDGSGKVTVPDVPAGWEYRVFASKGEQEMGMTFWKKDERIVTIDIKDSPPISATETEGGGFLFLVY